MYKLLLYSNLLVVVFVMLILSMKMIKKFLLYPFYKQFIYVLIKNLIKNFSFINQKPYIYK